MTHTLSVSPQNTGYRFGATYVGTKTTQQEGESFPVFLADTDISGNTSATFLHQFGDRWRVKMQAQTQGKRFSDRVFFFFFLWIYLSIRLSCYMFSHVLVYSVYYQHVIDSSFLFMFS